VDTGPLFTARGRLRRCDKEGVILIANYAAR